MKSNIRKLRNERQISQSTLAKAIGKTQQSISHMEKDRNCIPVESLLALADYFGVTTDYILGREENGSKTNYSDEEMLLKQETEGLRKIVKNGNNKLLYEMILTLLLCSLEEQSEPASQPSTAY